MFKIDIRPIKQSDNVILASIIRSVLTEFNCNRPGTVYADPQTDFLFEQYTHPLSCYFVAELNHEVVGGAGIGLLPGLNDTCELQKMYLLPHSRNKGIARELLMRCTEFAINSGFKRIYLESLKELHNALRFYEMNGFAYLDRPLLNTGHFSCDKWMIKSIV